jgi:hypothetical protein
MYPPIIAETMSTNQTDSLILQEIRKRMTSDSNKKQRSYKPKLLQIDLNSNPDTMMRNFRLFSTIFLFCTILLTL